MSIDNHYNSMVKGNGTGVVMAIHPRDEGRFMCDWSYPDGTGKTSMWLKDSHFAVKGKEPTLFEELTQYSVYGTGCQNKSPSFRTEEEAMKYAEDVAFADEWTGKVVVCQTTPLYEVTGKKSFFRKKITKKPIRRSR